MLDIVLFVIRLWEVSVVLRLNWKLLVLLLSIWFSVMFFVISIGVVWVVSVEFIVNVVVDSFKIVICFLFVIFNL